MSNPTELPDLDKLEVFWTDAKKTRSLPCTDPEQVLALIALARRAQPEGEAPQATFGQEVTRLVAEIRKPCSMAWRDSLVEQLIELIDPSHAATLSPLCGAQHAEAAWECRRYCKGDGEWTEWRAIGAEEYERRKDDSAFEFRALAAQQAAAPANYPAIPDGSTSAPGTPEAPADDGEKEFARGVIAALGVLTPHGYTHGSVLHDEIVSTIGAKVIYRHAEDEDYAWAGLNLRKKPRKRAAQLDGGQEGSERG